MNVGYSAKALVGATVAGLTAAQVALQSPGITAGEWTAIALAVLTTFGGVFVTSNTPGPVRAVNVTVTPKEKPPGAYITPVTVRPATFTQVTVPDPAPPDIPPPA